MCLKEGSINIFFKIDLLKIIIWLIFLEGILTSVDACKS